MTIHETKDPLISSPYRLDLYCHDCRDWQESAPQDERDETASTWQCGRCAATILCDVCGEPWTTEHFGVCTQ